MRILIADDSRDVAEVVAFGARMTWQSCAVTVAESGAEALRRFGEESPDLVVLDVAMPPPDGFEVCRRIRETSQVPILMLTVQDATVDKVRVLDFGADDYRTKRSTTWSCWHASARWCGALTPRSRPGRASSPATSRSTSPCRRYAFATRWSS